ncbi:MAG: fimbrillin family protein [Rikenellaceae bacterium]
MNNNSNFQTASTHGSFNVKALVSSCTYNLDYGNDASDAAKILSYTMTPDNGAAADYFNFNILTYLSSKWQSSTTMYWPNTSRVLHFAAYSPATEIDSKDVTFSYTASNSGFDSGNVPTTTDAYSYSFDYKVTDVCADQIDLMYAMTKVDYLAPADQVTYGGMSYITSGANSTTLLGNTNDEDAVNLHFKHALTQIAFTAIKDDAIDVYVKSITLCNLYNNGKFTATEITDDSDDRVDANGDAIGDNTVGNSGNAADYVNADNFGSWDNNFASDGWGTEGALTNTAADGYGYGYYRVADDNHTFFYAIAGTGGHSSMSHYEAALATLDTQSPAGTAVNSIKVAKGTTATALTSSSDVLMLMPQQLTAWKPTTSTGLNCIGFFKNKTATNTGDDYVDPATGTIADIEATYTASGTDYPSSSEDYSVSYLAIDCEIYSADMTSETAVIHDGYIFVPFDTSNLDYSKASVDDADTTTTDRWLPGYKITYCLDFGGGYIVEEGHSTTIPEPGCIPDTTTNTLRTMTFTTTVDKIVDYTEDTTMDLDEYDTSL